MEPISSGGGEASNAAGIKEEAGQPSVRSTLIWIPALRRGLDVMALLVPSNSESMRMREPVLCVLLQISKRDFQLDVL